MNVSRSGRSRRALLPPRVEVPARRDRLVDPLVVEASSTSSAGHEVVAAEAVLDARPARRSSSRLAAQEPVVRRPVALDQGVADEQLAGVVRIDRRVGHQPAGHDGQPVEA